MTNQSSTKILGLSFLILALPFVLNAQIKVSKLFSDHMVLQRGISNPVWGWGKPGDVVNVTIQDQMHSATCTRDGKWKVNLDPMKAGGPFVLQINVDKQNISFKDVLVGDVWICSGQSNMEWFVEESNNAKEETAKAMDSKIRHFKIPHSHSLQSSEELDGGTWEVCSPETVGKFTAVGYYFAKNLRSSEQVPIGLLNTSWGGSRIEPWMSPEALGYENDLESSNTLGREAEKKTTELKERLMTIMGEIPTKDVGIQNGTAVWAGIDHNEEGWAEMSLPGLWEEKGLQGLDGNVWYRKTIELTADQAAQNAVLSLGKIDDNDVTWVNGKKIGITNSYNTSRLYKVPGATLKAGKNVITVQVMDTGGGGGFWGDKENLFLLLGENKVDLANTWKYKVALVNLQNAFQPNQVPTILYHKMIQPILGYGIKGVIWYQGESNAGSIEDAAKYAELFPGLINDWRQRWNKGDFPFLWVQLANWLPAQDQPGDSNWALLRESQTKTLAVKNTAQAVIIDIGDADDIHPRNKQDVGKRLAFAARKIAYGKEGVYSGPIYKSMKIEKNRIRLSFDHVGSGLMIKKGTDQLHEFAIAGKDMKFVWAKAAIEGDEIIVWNDKIKKPIAVRYAWANNPDKANLYNAEGFPASPFRTDGDLSK